MNSVFSDDGAELLVSPRLVLILLVSMGMILYFMAEMLDYQWLEVSQAIWFFVMVVLLSIAGWLAVGWRPVVGRWFTLGALAAVLHLGGFWLHLPGTIVWAVIPTALAVPLVGSRGAAVVPVWESVIVLGLMRYPSFGFEPSVAAAVLVAIWSVFGATWAAYRAIRARLVWMEEYFEGAQQSLEETREYRVASGQAFQDLAHANRQLLLMNERVSRLRLLAEEAQKAKTSFVARVSHEFRTPLNMIIGMVELMVDTPEIYDVAPSPRMQEALRVVYRNSHHLSNMVNDVLDLTQTETDRMVLHRERVAMREVIDSAAEAVRPLLESKRLTLRIVEPDDTPPVYCDRIRIEQVILNLLSNAARYTDEGGITVTLCLSDQRVRVSVADTGPGIPEQELQRIFEPFRQGSGDPRRLSGGSGLGLSISLQLVKLHAGRMWVESVLGAGSTFSFELPISAPIPALGRPGHQVREDWVWRERVFRPSLPDSHHRPRFIVCDETGDLYNALTRSSDEIEFIDTRGSAEALRVMRQAPAHAVMINVEALEPLHPGVEILKRECSGTPIVVCSVPRSLKRARALGLLGQLIKPVTRAALAQALQALDVPVRRILVVDDDPDAAELFRQMLHVCDESLVTIVARNGAEALDWLRKDPPDLMLLDLVMPGVDGRQVLETMAGDDRIAKVPTFFVSALDPSDEPVRSSFLLATIDDGFSVNQLLRSSLELSNLLLQPEGRRDPAPG